MKALKLVTICNMRKKAMALLLVSLGLGLTHAPNVRADVTKSERALVVVVELDTHGMRELRPLYQALEQITISMTQNPVFTGDNYRVIRVLKNSDATFARYKATLKALAADPSIDAIDTVMSLHGSNEHLAFADGTWSLSRMRDVLLMGVTPADQALVTKLKKKLRMLYNTSCFGASHRGEFRQMGYDVVAGSVGVNANSELEFPSVLAQWASNTTFADAFQESNNDVSIAMTDTPIRMGGELANNSLKFTNSKKVFSGDTSIRITSESR